MWFATSEPTIVVYMEEAQCPQQQQLSPTNSSSYSPSARPRKQQRTASGKSLRKAANTMRNVTCAPSQVLCRYANKKCSNPRAVKRTGGLHTFCAMHRENANRNQRRLDLRKRLQKQAQQSSAQLDSTCAVDSKMEFIDLRLAPLQRQQQQSPDHSNHSDSLYEPLATPTPLRDEDVTTLITLFASADQLNQDPRCLEDVPMPREPATLSYDLYAHLSELHDDDYEPTP
ncbi:hypothetical protein Gpo141_00012434 [Globisporangium polare]